MRDDNEKKTLNKLRASKIVTFLVIGTIVFVFIYIFEDISRKGYDSIRLETIKVGNQVVKSLDSYKSENHRYPETLVLLTKVPKPKLGKEWIYKPSKDGQKYELWAGYKKRDGSFNPALYFKSGNSEWQYFDQDDSIEFP